MPNPGNGRNVAVPDENRPSWRPQDEHVTPRSRRTMSEEDERGRYRSMRPRDEWEDREWEREDTYQGQSGYAAGQGGDDAHERTGWRTQRYPGGFEDRYRDRQEERPGWRPESSYDRYRPRGYGDAPNLGTGGMHPGYEMPRGHRGKGPSGYQRSDERIREMVCEVLTEDDRVDATHVEVAVHGGEVILTGTVDDRAQKRAAEDAVENVPGIKDIQNHIRVGERSDKKK